MLAEMYTTVGAPVEAAAAAAEAAAHAAAEAAAAAAWMTEREQLVSMMSSACFLRVLAS
jgi:hypothetical protein